MSVDGLLHLSQHVDARRVMFYKLILSPHVNQLNLNYLKLLKDLQPLDTEEGCLKHQLPSLVKGYSYRITCCDVIPKHSSMGFMHIVGASRVLVYK